jgi:hypothetical protein
MNEKIKAAVDAATAPLKAEIDDLKAKLASLAPLAKATELPPTVKEAHAIFSAIPEATVKALKVVKVGFDPEMVWFQMVREDGTRISVKKQENDVRVRVRDRAGVSAAV